MKFPAFFILTLTILISKQVQSADTTQKNSYIILNVGASYQFGLSDLGKRYSTFSSITAGAYFRSPKKFIIGGEYGPYLGNNVSIYNLYGNIVGPTGVIIDKNGNPAVIRYYMRGYYLQGYLGKVFALKPQWKHSGIQVKIGGGFMQHRIKMRFDKGLVPQLEDDYKEGYDRLTNGFMFTQNIQYQYFDFDNLSLVAGVNFAQGFTKNRRNWNYSEFKQDNTLRHDFYFGFNLGILIPIALKSNVNHEYYN